MNRIKFLAKSAALSLLDLSKHRGHDLWRDMRYFHRVIDAPETATLLDVGANEGQTASAMAKAFPRSPVYSFEPCLDSFNKLVSNTARYKNVSAVKLGFGDTRELREIEHQKFSTTNSLLAVPDPSLTSETIEIDTIDSFVAARNIDRIFLLKTDTEGFDLKVLNGASGSFRKKLVDYVLVEACFFKKMSLPQTDFTEVSNLLRDVGFHVSHMYENVYDLSGFLEPISSRNSGSGC